MAIYYASVGYTSDPDHRQRIPAGGNHPLKFPTNEQFDPWEMHPKRDSTGYVVDDYILDNRAAMFIPPVNGLAYISVDCVWTDGIYTRRYNIVAENVPYENNFHADLDPVSWTSMMRVKRGEPFAILVGHDSPDIQGILSARVQVAVHDDIARPADTPTRGTRPRH